MTIQDGTVVELDYTLHLGDGEVIDRSDPEKPMTYVHGLGQLVPGLERALAGMEPGQSKSVVIPAEEGYGTYDPTNTREVPKTSFMSDFENKLEPGMQFSAMDSHGEEHPFTVKEVREQTILADFNHPLASQTLHYDVTVRSVRELTREDVEKAQPGPTDMYSVLTRGGHGPSEGR